jgi:UDPglucose 6-dehydrogenase
VIDSLLNLEVGKIQVFDPVAQNHVQNLYQNESKMYFAKNNYDALTTADALIILTEWDEFRMPDFEKIGNLLNQKIIIDGRNIWNKKEMLEMGFVYEGIGR